MSHNETKHTNKHNIIDDNKSHNTITKRLVNLTDHPVRDKITGNVYPKGEQWARAEVSTYSVGIIDDVPIRKSIITGVSGLPDEEEGVVYIVGSMVLAALKTLGIERDDVVAPGPVKRDKNGKIDGCDGFRV